jgi:O-antigen/teichoic acid export membrane protein
VAGPELSEAQPGATEPRLSRRSAGRRAHARASTPASLIHQLGWSSAWAFLGKAVALGLAVLTSAILARLLTPAELGTYFVIANATTVASALALLGLQGIVVRLVAQAVAAGEPARARAAVTRTALIAAVAVALAGALLASPVGEVVGRVLLGSGVAKSVMPLVALLVAATALRSLTAETFRGFHRVGAATLVGESGPAIVLALLALGAWVTTDAISLRTAIWFAAGASLLVLLPAAPALARRVAAMPRGYSMDARQIVAAALPFLFGGVMWLAINQFDVLILAALAPKSEVVLYGAAAKLSGVLSLPLIVVNAVVPSFITTLATRGERDRLERMLRISATAATAVTLGGAAVLILERREILHLLFGGYYTNAGKLLVILSVGDIAFAATGTCAIALSMTGFQREAARVAMVCGALTLAAGGVAASAWGAVGLAVVMSTGIALMNVVMVAEAKRKVGIFTHVLVSPRGLRTAFGRNTK